MPNWPTNKHALDQIAVLQVATISKLNAELAEGNLDWLSESEQARYQAMTSPSRKSQYLAGHYLLRKLASRIYKNQPTSWTYYQDAEKLRRLKSDQTPHSDLYVSISHSGDYISAGISTTPIGIDIETFSKQRDFVAIATHVFSAAEISFLKSCDAEALKQNFYLHWTLKECAAKQYGAGLKFEISRIQSPVLVSEGSHGSMQSWQCPDYVIAMACDVSVKIEIYGLCDNAKHQRWKNIPSAQ